MATFLLIHGAWHGGWCWEALTPELEARGHEAHALDLPAHGDDPAEPGGVTMDDYVARVTTGLRALPEPAILLGHSMGGMVVSAAAESERGRVRALVYLCAFLPRDGESLASIEHRNPRPTVSSRILADEAGGTLAIAPEHHRALFYGDVDDAVVARAQGRLRPQPMAPFVARLSLGEAFAGTPKHYVECTRDGAISIELQRDMVAATPGVTVHTLDADHSPFLSHPAALAAILDRIAHA